MKKKISREKKNTIKRHQGSQDGIGFSGKWWVKSFPDK